MANTVAIAGACEAIIRLLRANYNPADFGGAALDFQVYVSQDFNSGPMDEGVSLFLYRIYYNGSHRTPAGRVVNGRRQRTMLPLDLHFLLTAWGKKASLQHEIAGWAMRVLEDFPSVPAGLLNTYKPDVFHPDETVEIAIADLSVEEMFRIWEVMANHVYQLSIPYVARIVQLESSISDLEAPRVQERVEDMWTR
jgi:hypothetical protein